MRSRADFFRGYDKGLRRGGDSVNDDQEVAHYLVKRRAKRHSVSCAKSLHLNADVPERASVLADDVDTARIARGWHHIPAH